MTSGDLLREARLRSGLSQAELARRAGKATSVIGRWERGEVHPSLETLQELIHAAGLELRFRLEDGDDGRDALVKACLELTPQQRFEQLEEWAEFVSEARENLASHG
jgi:transcriptional regulator with XRE-family HTH domain